MASAQSTQSDPSGDTSASQALSQNIAKVRTQLTDNLSQQVDQLLGDELIPAPEGPPFTNLNALTPTAEALKKLLNCLYYAEKLALRLEDLEHANSWDQARNLRDNVRAVNQFHDALALLDNVTPELHELITNNYYLIEPILSSIQLKIIDSEYLNEFNEKNRTEKAQIITNNAIELFGADVDKEDENTSLVDAFSKIAQIIEVVKNAQEESDEEASANQSIELFCKLLLDLDNNRFFRKLTYENINESKIFRDFMDWVITVQQEGMLFTPNTLKKYQQWVNGNLPQLMIFIDQVEQSNYLKSGIISQKIASSVDELSKQANQQLDDSEKSIKISDTLAQQRIDKINERQQQLANNIKKIITQKQAADEFYSILIKYRNYQLSNITEIDRQNIIELYPHIQMPLAYCNLQIENALTQTLKQLGPARDTRSSMHAAGAIIALNINDLLETQNAVNNYFGRQRSSEKLKFKIAQKAKERLSIAKEPEQSFNDRVSKRIQELLEKQTEQHQLPLGSRDHLQAVEITDLNTLRSSVIKLQQLQLSKQLPELRTLITVVLTQHIATEEAKTLNNPPFVINHQESQATQQIKQLLNSLYYLEGILAELERQDSNAALVNQMVFLYQIKDSVELTVRSIKALDRSYKKHLEPLITQIKRINSLVSAQTNTTPATEDITSYSTVDALLPNQTEPPKFETQIQTLQDARENILQRCQTCLSAPIADKLHAKAEGVPFTIVQDDPPQVETIKKLINCLYTTEMGYQIWQRKAKKSVTKLDKLIYNHQLVATLTQVYKTFELFDSAPEMQSFIADNYDLLAPVYETIDEFINSSGITSTLKSERATKTAGSMIGQGVNLLQPKKDAKSHSSPVIQVLSELPIILNELSHKVDKEIPVNARAQKVKERKVEALSIVFEYLFTDRSTTSDALANASKAVSAYKEISNLINQQGEQFRKTTLIAYQHWMQTNYPILLSRIDDLETQYNLVPGSLSKAIIAEIDPVNDRLNDLVEEHFINELPLIPLSSNLKLTRAHSLQKKVQQITIQQAKNTQQQSDAHEFFQIWSKYQTLTETLITTDDMNRLKKLFTAIQIPLANTDLALANALVPFLNHKNTDRPAINKILKLETQISAFLEQEQRRFALKKEIVNTAITNLDLAEEVPVVDEQLISTEDSTEETTLTTLTPEDLHHAKGNLSYLQNLKMSEISDLMKNNFTELTKKYLSPLVLPYLQKTDEEACHKIKNEDPNLIRQIKGIENSLTKLNQAFKHFEQMHKDRSMVFQMQAFINIRQEVMHTVKQLYALPPDFKEHYGPLIEDLEWFCNKIKAIDYNKEDLKEFQALLKDTKRELLKKRKDQIRISRKGFFRTVALDQVTPDVRQRLHTTFQMEDDNRPENTRELRKRAAKLASKYTHLASPAMEKARRYLIDKFPSIYSSEDTSLCSLSREQLADEEYMQGEIDRLTHVFSARYGYNYVTVKSLYQLLKQSLRAGAQLNELNSMTNELIVQDYVEIKENAYTEIIYPLSKREDDLGLKAGTLVSPAMTLVNQLFLSIALELDMPFADKLELFNESRFLKRVIDLTQLELESLESQQEAKPLDIDLPLKIALKKDKIDQMQQHYETIEANLSAPAEHKANRANILDNFFEVSARKHLHRLALESPIAEQYRERLKAIYDDNKAGLLKLSDSEIDRTIQPLLEDYKTQYQPDYIMVDKTLQMLEKLHSVLPDKYAAVKYHLEPIIEDLKNPNIEITQRANQVKDLPKDSDFNRYISSVDGGPSFLMKLKQFIERVISSAIKAIRTGKDFMTFYDRKGLNQTLDNLEQIESFYQNQPKPG